MDNDQRSLFEYEPDPDQSYAPDSFNLTQLNRAVCEYFRRPCQLRKLGEGSFHKVDPLRCIEYHPSDLKQVYDILCADDPEAVVRVARPGMARDKMESEVSQPVLFPLTRLLTILLIGCYDKISRQP